MIASRAANAARSGCQANQPPLAVNARIDHLVVACADLAQGDAWLREQLGVPSLPGGRHVLMGTHNRLLKLGPRAYLELIAIDPEGSAQRPRWFGLDSRAVRDRMARGPFLLTWVASCDDVGAVAASLPRLGDVIAASRGNFSWRITVPADGRLNFDGVLPTLIQWDGQAHPCDGLEERGCTMLELRLAHTELGALRPLFSALALPATVQLNQGDPSIAARVRTPRGEVELR